MTGLDHEEAGDLLKDAHWNVKAAIVMVHAHVGYHESLALLKQASDSVRAAIGDETDTRLRDALDPR